MVAIDEIGRIYTHTSSYVGETGDSVYSLSHDSNGRRLFHIIRTVYQYCTESIVINTQKNQSVIKLLLDNINTGDKLYKVIRHNMIVESILLSDNITRTIYKLLKENIGVVESNIKTVEKILIQNINVVNIILKTISKQFVENIMITTNALRTYVKVLTETIVIITNRPAIVCVKFILEYLTVTTHLAKSVIKVFIESLGIENKLNWLRPLIFTAKYTITEKIKNNAVVNVLNKATNVILGGEEVE